MTLSADRLPQPVYGRLTDKALRALLAVKAAGYVQHLLASQWVEHGRRFVQHQHSRLHRQHAGKKARRENLFSVNLSEPFWARNLSL